MKGRILIILTFIIAMCGFNTSAHADSTIVIGVNDGQGIYMGIDDHTGLPSTSIVEIFNQNTPFPYAATDNLPDSLISIQPPASPLVVNIKTNRDVSKQGQNLKEIYDQIGTNTLINEWFTDRYTTILGYMCYQLCIPLEIRFFSDDYSEPFSFLITVEILDQIYNPQKQIINQKK